MTRTAVHVYPDRHPVVGNLNPSGHLSVTVATNYTVGSDDPATMHALADAFRTAAKKLEDHLLAADRDAARAVNSNRTREPFGSLPDRMPARITTPAVDGHPDGRCGSIQCARCYNLRGITATAPDAA